MAVTETFVPEGHIVDSLLRVTVPDLTDRGSHQTRGVVTDVGPFQRQPADRSEA